jgi:hypothetical protein
LTLLKAYFKQVQAKEEERYRAQLPEICLKLYYFLIRLFKLTVRTIAPVEVSEPAAEGRGPRKKLGLEHL